MEQITENELSKDVAPPIVEEIKENKEAKEIAPPTTVAEIRENEHATDLALHQLWKSLRKMRRQKMEFYQLWKRL